jgi:hypothetical protein
MPGRRAELEREADEDHAPVERADHARPRGVLDEGALASLEILRGDDGVGTEPHRDG